MFLTVAENGMSHMNVSICRGPELGLLMLCLSACTAAVSHESVLVLFNPRKLLEHPLAGLSLTLN